MPKEIKEKIDIWEMWGKNWENAKRFFYSKGNIKTRSRLKDRWFKEFAEEIKILTQRIIKNK